MRALLEGCEERDADIESMLKPCAKDAKSKILIVDGMVKPSARGAAIENLTLKACVGLARRM